MIDVFVIIFVLMVGIVGLFYVIVCFFMVFDVKGVCVFVGYVLVFIVIFYIMVLVIVVFVCINFIEMVSNQLYVDMLEWFSKWEQIGFIVFDDKNNDGII